MLILLDMLYNKYIDSNKVVIVTNPDRFLYSKMFKHLMLHTDFLNNQHSIHNDNILLMCPVGTSKLSQIGDYWVNI